MRNYNFKFAGVALSDFFGVTTTRPPREVAEYDFSLLDIPGRSGSEYLDNKRYKNVPMIREIGFAQHSYNYIDNLVEKVINWLAYRQGYQEFEDSDHPGMITYAVLTNFNEVQTILRRHHKATLKFSRVPFWYDKAGLNPIVVEGNATNNYLVLNNLNPIESKPLIEIVLKSSVTSASSFEMKYIFGGTETEDYTYNLSSLPITTANSTLRKYIFFDTENEEVRLSTAETGGDIAYADVSMIKGFKPGKIQLCVWSGYSTTTDAMKIVPRWRCL